MVVYRCARAFEARRTDERTATRGEDHMLVRCARFGVGDTTRRREVNGAKHTQGSRLIGGERRETSKEQRLALWQCRYAGFAGRRFVRGVRDRHGSAPFPLISDKGNLARAQQHDGLKSLRLSVRLARCRRSGSASEGCTIDTSGSESEAGWIVPTKRRFRGKGAQARDKPLATLRLEEQTPAD